MDVLNQSTTPTFVPQPDCLLLQLPAELRDLIYRHALKDDSVLQLHRLRSPRLLRMCRQIRDEGASVYFFQNRFILTVSMPKFDYEQRKTASLRRKSVVIPPLIEAMPNHAKLRDVTLAINGLPWDGFCMYISILADSSSGRATIVHSHELRNGHKYCPLSQNRLNKTQQALDSRVGPDTMAPGVERGSLGGMFSFEDVASAAAALLPGRFGRLTLDNGDPAEQQHRSLDGQQLNVELERLSPQTSAATRFDTDEETDEDFFD